MKKEKKERGGRDILLLLLLLSSSSCFVLMMNDATVCVCVCHASDEREITYRILNKNKQDSSILYFTSSSYYRFEFLKRTPQKNKNCAVKVEKREGVGVSVPILVVE